MGIVARDAGETRIVGIVPTAQRDAVGLEPHIVDTAKIRHHSHCVGTAMAGSAEFLGESIGIEFSRIEDVTRPLLPCSHGSDVLCPRPVT